MAKIIEVTLDKVPEYIKVDDNKKNKILVNTKVQFHPLDILNNMEYMLHLFIYDINGEKDVPVVIYNWDETTILRVVNGKRKDDFLSKENILIKSDEIQKEIVTFKTQITIQLGNLQNNTSLYGRQFEVFATLQPAISRVSKWSETFESKLVF
ncbi:hypothetical protein [Aquimarina algicola]|uniref:Uncharacterized protein n=1 Tax=Aquimarina algicola TaxID=2589995 RepID=A0A504J0S5_9FLAO|nr:hypothetical protein [Aquimarina algicola]TPN84436.1 hypothetical protein FHK87_16005 [Aquimarina algicola]